MKAEPKTLQGILQSDRRFIVPVYQRPYAWNREQQWELLWADVKSTAERLAHTRLSAHRDDKAANEADNKATPHFLGAIVVERFPTATGDAKTRLVVDGQQRLITLQLLLMGTLDALRSVGTPRQLAQLRKLTRNDREIHSGDHIYKVWPREMEADSYRKAVADDAPSSDDSNFAAAREFFSSEARIFLEDESVPNDPYCEGDAVQSRVSLLVPTLLALLKLVVIDLEDVDDAQVIFEALNARSTPLSATDLVKNLLFMRAEIEGLNTRQLYHEHWDRFDKSDKWWREEIGSGHAGRARQDWLIGDWLIAERGRVINVRRLYSEFRRWLDKSGKTADSALDELARYADAYEGLHDRMTGVTIGERLSFKHVDQLNVAVATPVLLWLLTRPCDHLDPGERELAFRAIESFVIRRMAVKYQTRAYGNAFAEVLRAAQNADTHPGRAIVRALSQGPHGYSWPTDEELASQFKIGRYYGPGGIHRSRLRLLLGAVDERLHRDDYSKAEPVSQIQYEKLHVEHVLPKSWQEHWAIVESDTFRKKYLDQERADHVHRIGNLTLVSEKLNSAMNNAPWVEKKTELKKHSHLRLNARLIDEAEWDEQSIRDRGEWLAGVVAEIWPGPDSDEWS